MGSLSPRVGQRFGRCAEQPGEFQITLHKTQELLDKVNRTVTDVDGMLNTNEKSIREMIGPVTRVTGRVDDLLVYIPGKIDTTISNV